MNNPMIRMTGGMVDEDDSLIARVNVHTLSGEIKSIIFDSFASLDDNNTEDCFGLDIETAMKAMESSPSLKQHPMYETLSSLTSAAASSLAEKPLPVATGRYGGRVADDNTCSSTSVTSENDDSTKPTRPLSSYNLFFQLERERILSGTDHLPITADDVERVAIARRIADRQPDKPKRKHRKSHGKITFAELARAIANRWRGLDASSKGLLIERAALEKSRFLRELEEWTKIHGADEEDQQQDNVGLKEARMESKSPALDGKPPKSQRPPRVFPDVSISQSRSPMQPPVNRIVTPDARMKCAMEMTAFANMRISNTAPSSSSSLSSSTSSASPMLKSHSMYNSFQQSPYQSSLGTRFDDNLHRPPYNNLPSLNSAIAARNHHHQSFSFLPDDSNTMPLPSRLMSSHVCDPRNSSTLLRTNHRDMYHGQLPNNLTYPSTTPLMIQQNDSNNNTNYSDQSSNDMEQLFASAEYELNCSKLRSDNLSKLLATIQRNRANNNNSNNNNNNNHHHHHNPHGSSFM